jgi:hypothetical protein
LTWHERTLGNELSHHSVVPVYTNVFRALCKVTLRVAQEGPNSARQLTVVMSECHIHLPR